VSITKYHTVTVLGLPMKVIARGARELIDKYDTASVNVGGGEAYDVVVDTLGVDPGTYFVYITELNELSNNQQSFGGPMTEIVVVPPAF
ncbi:MAG: multicopper oxidase family protein, partial [Desulfobacterales bacterium]|nr:multicopper oxidase family protein [Desulfobacterales bacterium]